MRKLFLWARHNPLQWTVVVIVFLPLVDYLFLATLGWEFTWAEVVNQTICTALLGIGFWSWRKYEKENNVTTILYKDRKKEAGVAANSAV